MVLKFDCSNAFNIMPRQLILDAVQQRAPGLMPTVMAWLSQRTTHFYWGEGRTASPIHASRGVDQGCPLSPALFAIGIADALEYIQSSLVALALSSRVFSYLDDIIVVVPAAVGESALDAVVRNLEGVGLTVNAGKTAAWTLDPSTALPARLQGLRKDRCEVLGAMAPWLDADGDFSRVGVHNLTNGVSVVDSAKAFVTKVVELRGAGLSAKGAFLLLRAFSQGHVIHLLRSNHECGDCAKQFDEILLRGLEHLVGLPLSTDERAQ